MGRKPTLPEKRIVTKIYLDKDKKAYALDKPSMSEYINNLIAEDMKKNEKVAS